MRLRFSLPVMMVVVAAACPLLGTAAAHAAGPRPNAGAAAAGRWGRARQVPGTEAGLAQAQAVSCPSAGNCTAVGYDGRVVGPQHMFVIGETGGRRGRARSVAAALAGPRGGQMYSVSCSSPGNCSAGGTYYDARYDLQAFVASEAGGRWRPAEEVPGTAALNTAGRAEVDSVSCPSPGNCSAGGGYLIFGRKHQNVGLAFVVNESHGVWGQAREVAGALNTGFAAAVNSVSCVSAGNCVAAGAYDTPGGQRPFVVSEVNGRWHAAGKVPGIAVLNTRGDAVITSVSCASPGNCGAGGYVQGGYTDAQAFVVSQVGGVWGKAREVAVMLNQGTSGTGAGVDAVSCAAPGDCAAGGSYTARDGARHAFVVSEADGRWGQAQEVAGGMDIGGGGTITSVSCPSAGACAAGGLYRNASGDQAFVVGENAGQWGPAEEIPGITALNTGGEAVTSEVSCAAPRHCNAVGYYSTSSLEHVAFVASET